MKKKSLIIALGVILLLVIGFVIAVYTRPLDMNSVNKKPYFKGIVMEVMEGYAKIRVIDHVKESNIKNDQTYLVSRDVQLADSWTDLEVNNILYVYFDGTIIDDEIPKIDKVYAFALIGQNKEPLVVGMKGKKYMSKLNSPFYSQNYYAIINISKSLNKRKHKGRV